MPQPKSIHIHIPNPCSQNWDEMTPVQQGRFCGHCQKGVIDFTEWSDTALYNFLSKNNGHLCGRFLSTQVDKPIAIPYQPSSRLYRIALALGFTLLFTEVPTAFAQNRPPKTEQTSVLKQGIHPEKDAGMITGQTLGENKQPLLNTEVTLYQNGILLSTNFTDYDGNFAFISLYRGYYDVVATSIGYKGIKTENVIAIDGESTILNLKMVRKTEIDSATVINHYRLPLKVHFQQQPYKPHTIISGNVNFMDNRFFIEDKLKNMPH